MLIYSFDKGYKSLFNDKQRAVNYVLSPTKPFKHTRGFAWCNPTTYEVDISANEAVKIINGASFVDIEEKKDYIHINTFTANDLY